MTAEHRRRVAESALRIRRQLWPELPDTGACVYSCAAVILAARVARVARGGSQVPPLVLQAGTVAWRFVDPADDDGASPTHFSYQWDPGHPLSVAARAAGRLPEMHAWLGDVAAQEIVDISTGGIAADAATKGFAWGRAPRPPEWLWGKPPAGAVYEPDRDATIYAGKIVAEILAGVRAGDASLFKFTVRP